MREAEWFNSALPNTVSQKLLQSVKKGENHLDPNWITEAVNAAKAKNTSYDKEIWLGVKGIVEYYERQLSQMEPKKYPAVNAKRGEL